MLDEKTASQTLENEGGRSSGIFNHLLVSQRLDRMGPQVPIRFMSSIIDG
jgi:hypothetical protein